MRLTASQHKIWLGQRLAEDVPLYNSLIAFFLRGPLKVEAFRQAFDSLVAGCDALRMAVEEHRGRPVPVVRSPSRYDLPLLDFSHRPDQVEAWLEQRARAVLKLDDRLFEAGLLRVDPELHVWYLSLHHLIGDAWSFSVVFHRLASLYKGESCREPRFGDFLAAQKNGSTHSACSEEQAMSFYGRRPGGGPLPSRRVSHGLDEGRCEQLKAVAGRPPFRSLTADLSLSGVLLTAYVAYLHRITGERSITVGAPAHNRTTAEHKETVGLFMEMLPLCLEVAPEDTFSDLGRKTMESLGRFLRGSTEPRPYQAVFNFIHARFGDFAGLPCTSRWVHSGYSDSDHALRLLVHDFDDTGSFQLLFDLAEGVFDSDLCRRTVAHFTNCLDALLADPEQTVGAVEILTPQERAATTTRQDYPQARLIDLFEERAARHPDAPALVCEDVTLSYRETDRRAAQLAARLEIDREQPVALDMERGVDLVVAMLAVLKAGGMYLPLDPGSPPERLRQILDQAGSPPVLRSPLELGTSSPATRPGRPDDLAYLLFTSGSTGRPKGVCCAHRGLVNLLSHFERCWPLAAGSRCSWWTSPGFDVSVYEIFSALCYGHALHVVPEAVRRDTHAYLSWLSRNRIESAYVPPFMLAELAGWEEPLALRRLLVGVEPILETTLARLVARHPGLRVINGYGPTEATVCATLYEVPRNAPPGRWAPIGKPVPNMRAAVLDEQGRPVPWGMPGELHLAGPGLAHGYLHGEEERFYQDTGGERWYRTGDLVRRLPDGNLAFLGRNDDQLKTGGYRAEPAEIETALLLHPEVREAAVALEEGHLVAYLVGDPQAPQSLRTFLRQRLPGPLIPSRFRFLDAFPRTTSGKVDRRRLRELDWEEVQGNRPSTPPQTPKEKLLARLWCETLNRDRIGREDNFFELGGDSIHAVRIASRAREHGLHFAAGLVFETQTLEGLAAAAAETVPAGVEKRSRVEDGQLQKIAALLSRRQP